MAEQFLFVFSSEEKKMARIMMMMLNKKWPHVSNWFKIIFLSHHLSIRLLFVGRWISKAAAHTVPNLIFWSYFRL